MRKPLLLLLQALLLSCQTGQAASAPVQRLLQTEVAEDEIVICNVCDSEPTAADRPDIRMPGLRPLPASLPYAREIAAVATELRMEEALIHAVVFVESAYQPRAISSQGAYGLMQVIPATARQYTRRPAGQLSTREHLQIGARYLKKMLESFDGDKSLALAAYNAGPASVRKHHGQIPPYAETQRYVPAVLYYYEQLKLRLASHP
ncbi:MAG TPA: lytic transglycosylase domain-containing protein [Methylophilus sp.]